MASVSLRGNLEDFGIAEVFQLVGQQRKTGILEFSRKGQRVRIAFDRGAVVSAAPIGPHPHWALGDMLVRTGRLTRERVEELHRECKASAHTPQRLAVSKGWLSDEDVEEIEVLLTRDTIFAILRWSGGSFDFQAQEVKHDRDPEKLLGAEQILMDALRTADEWQTFADQVPSDDIVFRSVGSFQDYRGKCPTELSHRLDAAERVFRLTDGRLTARRVIDLSLLGTFDGTRILADLRRAGVIEPVERAEVRRVRLRLPSAKRGAFLRARLAEAVALGLLVWVVALALPEKPDPDTSPGFAIRRAPLEFARSSHEARRVRQALETYRYSQGRWPVDLSELERRGMLESGALATPEGRPYYYSRRADGPLLLAPAR